MYIGVIDLGTNTFNLLIAQQKNKNYTIVHKTKGPVKLGEGGITEGIISEKAQIRGINVLKSHLDKIIEYKVEKIYAFATSAIRSADNGKEYVKRIKQELNLDINVISGTREAELIYLGVKQAVDITNTSLIIDIGGGSVEFIICNPDKVLWKESYRIGIARMLERFKPSDPVTKIEIINIQKYISDNISSLFTELEKYQIKTLIGSSGSFDTFAKMISIKQDKSVKSKINTANKINISEFNLLHQTLINSTINEREKMKGLELMRVEMIVLASILVDYIINKLNFNSLIQSNYALKEGVIFSVINKLIV